MEPTGKKLSFADYYKSLSELQGELRNRICSKLEISYKTFYNKINQDSWSGIERTAIDQIIKDFDVELSKNI